MSEHNFGEKSGWRPYLTIAGAIKAMEWYQEAFGATELERKMAEDGERLMHGRMDILGSTVMMSDEFPECCMESGIKAPTSSGSASCFMEMGGVDVDAVVERAGKAGATVVMQPEDTFWGARFAMVKDPFGHVWAFSNVPKGDAAAAAAASKE